MKTSFAKKQLPINSIEKLEQWLKKNCKKGEILAIHQSKKAICFSKLSTFSIKYKTE